MHPGAAGKPHRQRIAKLVGTRGVPVIKVRVAAPAPTNVGAPLPIMERPREPLPKPHSEPRLSLRNETRPKPQLAPPVYFLECGEPNFREPKKGEWVVGLYREDDGTPVPASTGWQKIGVKRITSQTTPKPDKTGSRAASTAQFSQLIVTWRQRRGLSPADAARLLCCTERTITNWERERAMPRGFTLRAIVTSIEGGSI